MRLDTGRTTISLLVALALLVSSIPWTVPVDANPIPVPPKDAGGEPYAMGQYGEEVDRNLTFKGEDIVFTVLNDKKVRVEAKYVFANKGGNTINVTIVLPFLEKPNDGVLIDVNGASDSLNVYENNHEVPDVLSQAVSANSAHLYLAEFFLSVPPNRTSNVSAKYEHHYWNEDDGLYKDYMVRYITVTGQLWPEPIKDAKFLIKIPKGLMSGEIKSSGFQKKVRGGNNEYSVEHTTWVPRENLQIEWSNINYEYIYWMMPCILLVVGIIVAIIVIIYVVHRRRKRARNRSGPEDRKGMDGTSGVAGMTNPPKQTR